MQKQNQRQLPRLVLPSKVPQTASILALLATAAADAKVDYLMLLLLLPLPPLLLRLLLLPTSPPANALHPATTLHTGGAGLLTAVHLQRAPTHGISVICILTQRRQHAGRCQSFSVCSAMM
jgi:hypothetical protein